MFYWKKAGIEMVPLEDVLTIRDKQQGYAHVFYDAFYAFPDLTPIP
jgi:hypothetical protein